MVGGCRYAVLWDVASGTCSIQLAAFLCNCHQAMTHAQTTCPNCIVLCVGKKGLHPAEVGTLAPVFEKSATELKLKQKLLKFKSTIQIATFNVRTLNRIGQLPELTASAIDHNIDITCVQEHRFLSLRVFGLLSSSLLFPQRFSRYILRPFSGVCQTWEPTWNYVLYWIHRGCLFWFH